MTSVILESHGRHHLDVDRTWELVKTNLGSTVTRAEVSKVLARCDECVRICPSVDSHCQGHIVE